MDVGAVNDILVSMMVLSGIAGLCVGFFGFLWEMGKEDMDVTRIRNWLIASFGLPGILLFWFCIFNMGIELMGLI